MRSYQNALKLNNYYEVQMSHWNSNTGVAAEGREQDILKSPEISMHIVLHGQTPFHTEGKGLEHGQQSGLLLTNQ